MFHKKVCLLFSIFFFSFCIFSESFRTSRMHPVYIYDDKEESVYIKAQCNDSIGIILPETIYFLNAVEIEVKVPQSFVNEYAFFEGYGIYFDVTPEIKASEMDYKGTNKVFTPFSEKITTVLQIPVRDNHGLKSSVYSTVIEIPERKNNQIIFRLMPLMKGLDDSFFSNTIDVKVKPLLSDEGAFKLKISEPESAPPDEIISVYIDGNLVEKYDYLKLKPGMHYLSVISENFRQETRNFSIKKGTVLEMEIPLRDLTPVVSFVAPEGAKLFFDDIEITEENKKELKTTPGPHKIKCIIGDFEISRILEAEKGGVYSVSMLLNIDITKIE